MAKYSLSRAVRVSASGSLPPVVPPVKLRLQFSVLSPLLEIVRSCVAVVPKGRLAESEAGVTAGTGPRAALPLRLRVATGRLEASDITFRVPLCEPVVVGE